MFKKGLTEPGYGASGPLSLGSVLFAPRLLSSSAPTPEAKRHKMRSGAKGTTENFNLLEKPRFWITPFCCLAILVENRLCYMDIPIGDTKDTKLCKTLRNLEMNYVEDLEQGPSLGNRSMSVRDDQNKVLMNDFQKFKEDWIKLKQERVRRYSWLSFILFVGGWCGFTGYVTLDIDFTFYTQLPGAFCVFLASIGLVILDRKSVV